MARRNSSLRDPGAIAAPPRTAARSPGGEQHPTTDEAWRSAFESVFLGAVRLARILAADLGGAGDGRPTGGSVAGAGGSIVFVLAPSVRVPPAELAISNGLFPGLAGVVKTLAGELGPAGIRVNGLLPVRIATNRVRELDALRGCTWRSATEISSRSR